MEYSLAKQLKEAGFPQKCKYAFYRYEFTGWNNEKGIDVFEKNPYEGDYQVYEHLADRPTLDELIEECGEDFDILQRKETDEPEK